VLIDPRDGDVRYVGMTVRSLEARLKSHLKDHDKKFHRGYWIRELRSLGIEPVIKLLEEVSESQGSSAERRWIKYYRAQGARLVNGNDGGQGGQRGAAVSEETREKLRLAAIKQFQDPEYRAAVSLVHTGKTISEEHRAIVGTAATRRWVEWRAAGGVTSEETRKKIRAAARGRTPHAQTAEARAKVAAAKKRADVPDELVLRLRDEESLTWMEIGRRVGMSGTGVHQRYDRIKNAQEARVAEEDSLPDVQFAVYPQRTCREPQTPDGFVDHVCLLPELHPGPCCPSTSAQAIKRRQLWEQAHPGWEQMARDPDPFAPFNGIPGVVLWSPSTRLPSSRCACGCARRARLPHRISRASPSLPHRRRGASR